MTTIPSENWPKGWLLDIHAKAVEHGYIFIEPISEANAETLRQRLYRIRRRSDKSTASFIPPEYHLVMIGRWEPGPAGHGRLPVIYNKLADGSELPNIRPAEAHEIAPVPEPIFSSINKPAFEPPADFNPILDPTDIASFVDKMTASAKRKVSEE